MGIEGDQQYEYTAYNLDVIISVGYRVKSQRGTKFRQWANKVIKDSSLPSVFSFCLQVTGLTVGLHTFLPDSLALV